MRWVVQVIVLPSNSYRRQAIGDVLSKSDNLASRLKSLLAVCPTLLTLDNLPPSFAEKQNNQDTNLPWPDS